MWLGHGYHAHHHWVTLFSYWMNQHLLSGCGLLLIWAESWQCPWTKTFLNRCGNWYFSGKLRNWKTVMYFESDDEVQSLAHETDSNQGLQHCLYHGSRGLKAPEDKVCPIWQKEGMRREKRITSFRTHLSNNTHSLWVSQTGRLTYLSSACYLKVVIDRRNKLRASNLLNRLFIFSMLEVLPGSWSRSTQRRQWLSCGRWWLCIWERQRCLPGARDRRSQCGETNGGKRRH